MPFVLAANTAGADNVIRPGHGRYEHVVRIVFC
jgi:hypothetical protein